MLTISRPRRARRFAILMLGIIIPQFILIGPSLIGQKVLLPLDLLKWPRFYLPSDKSEVSGDIFLSDLITQIEPNRRFAVNEIRGGRFPLWNPLSYCGAPFLAANQPAVFSPFRLLDYLWPSPMAIAWGQFIRAVVAGVGAYLFFRSALRVRFLPAAIGAWCYPITGFLTLWAGFPIGWEMVWLPLLLWSTHRTIARPFSRAWIGLALISAAVLVSGHAATAAQMLMLDGFFVAWSILYRSRREVPFRWLASRRVCAGWMIGFFLSLPQTLPTLEYMQSSYRIASRSAGYVESRPVGIGAIPQLILPYIFGSTETGSIYLLDGSRLEGLASGYAGLIMTLVVAPMAWLNRSKRSSLVFWCIAAIAGTAQILDIHPLSDFYRAPLLNALRNNRLVFITGFAITCWGVVGLDVLWRRWRIPLGLVFAILALPVGIGTVAIYRSSHLPANLAPAHDWFNRMYLLAALWCGLAIVLSLVITMQARRRMLVAMIGLIVVAELITSAWNVNPQSDWNLYYPKLEVLNAISEKPAGRICGADCLPAAINIMADLPDVRGYDAADPIRVVQLLEKVRDSSSPAQFFARTQWFSPRDAPGVLDLINLRYLIYQTAPSPPSSISWQGDGYSLVERATAGSRVFVPKTIEVIPDLSQRLSRMTQTPWDPREVLILESSPENKGDVMFGSAKIVNEHPSMVEISASMQTPGFVLLADQWDRGWNVYVNGKPQKIWLADHAFRAVAVAAGESRIEFRYEPASFTWGCYGAAVGAMLLAAAFFLRR